MKKLLKKFFNSLIYFIIKVYKTSINSGLELFAYNNTIKYVYEIC
jgi:hypothetical protein